MKRVVCLVVLLSLLAMGVSTITMAAPVEMNPNKKYTVVHWDFPHWAGYDQWIEEQAAKFHELYPNITIAPEVLSWAEGYGQKFEIAFASGNPPDVMYGGSERLNPRYVDEGLVVPVEPYLTQEDLNDYESFAIDHFTYNGHLYTWPRWISLHSWYGNRELMEAAGADIDKIQTEGWTWDEFYEIVKNASLKDRGDGKPQHGFMTDKDTAFQMMWMLTMNADLARDYIFFTSVSNEGEFLWKGENVVEAASLFRSLMDNGIMPKEVGGIASATRDQMFWNWDFAVGGRSGPYISGTRDQYRLEAQEGKRDLPPQGLVDVVLLPPPHKNGSVETPWIGGAGYFVFRQLRYKGDDHVAAAMLWAKFITDAERGGYASSRQKVVPARLSGQEMFREQLGLDSANGQFFLKSIQLAVKDTVRPSVDIANKASRIQLEVMQPLFQGFLAGVMSPEEYAASVEEKALQILAE